MCCHGGTGKEGHIQRELRLILNMAEYKPEGTLFLQDREETLTHRIVVAVAHRTHGEQNTGLSATVPELQGRFRRLTPRKFPAFIRRATRLRPAPPPPPALHGCGAHHRSPANRRASGEYAPSGAHPPAPTPTAVALARRSTRCSTHQVLDTSSSPDSLPGSPLRSRRVRRHCSALLGESLFRAQTISPKPPVEFVLPHPVADRLRQWLELSRQRLRRAPCSHQRQNLLSKAG